MNNMLKGKNHDGASKLTVGEVLGKTTDIIVMNAALPIGIAGVGMELFLRTGSNQVHGFNCFDAMTIGFLTLPVVKKTFDNSINGFKESITTENKTLGKLSITGLISNVAYVVFTAAAACSILSEGTKLHTFQSMPKESSTLFLLGIGAACVGVGAAVAARTTLMKKQLRY